MELVRGQLKEACRAVLNYLFDKSEASLSKFWIAHEVFIDHVESGVTKGDNYVLKVTSQTLSHFFHHGSKEVEDLRIS